MKVFYVSFTPPLPTWGGAMAFYRHFFELKDFVVRVATNCEQFPREKVPYEPILFGPSQLIRRLFRTRFLPWLYGPHSLTAFGRVPRRVWRAAREFEPDIIFTIAGSWDYSALVAERVARGLRVPLAASFNDWFNYGWFPSHPVYHVSIEQRFRRFYREADLALCTSEGMREALGPHRNGHILYPLGAKLLEPSPPFRPFAVNGAPFVVAFAGSLADWYGPMLERLVTAANRLSAPVEFRFYGSNPTWSRDFDSHARATGTYRGHLPFEQLRQEIAAAQALIMPMGFEAQCAQVERTSFKTKFLDYLSYQKPILVWGPEYCSAVRVAREFDSAEVCTAPDSRAIFKRILALRGSPSRQTALVNNARKMYEDRFHPDKTHTNFVRKMRQTVARFRGGMASPLPGLRTHCAVTEESTGWTTPRRDRLSPSPHPMGRGPE
jgi:glycosyltransferase involved in cell wall biosynthesis